MQEGNHRTRPFLHIVEKSVESGTTGAKVINFVVLPLLILAVLLLPPLSIPARIAEWGYDRVDQDGGIIRASDGLEMEVPAGAVARNIPLRIEVIPRLDFQKQTAGDPKAAAAAFAAGLDPLSPVYAFDARGNTVFEATLRIPIPTGVEPENVHKVDTYAWDGSRWYWIPSYPVVEDDQFVTTLSPVPQAIVLAEPAPINKPVVSAWLPQGGEVDAGAKDIVAEVNPLGLALNTDGTLFGELSQAGWSRDAKYLVIPTIQNRVADGFDADLVSNILQNNELRSTLLSNIVQFVNADLYAGIDLDIRGLGEEDREAYAAFISDLARELHKSQKLLSVTLPAPNQISEDTWDTYGYDWVAIGRAADSVKIAVTASPTDYLTRLRRTLAFAVTQVDRHKLQVILSTYSQVAAEDLIIEKPYAEVVKAATQVEAKKDPNRPALTNEALTLSLPNLAEAPTWDPEAKAFRLAYKDGNTVRSVWLESATSLAYKLRTIMDYNIRGIALRELLGDRNNPEIWDVVAVYARDAQVTAGEPPIDALKVAWNASGGQVQPATPSWLSIIWKAPDKEGKYTISATFTERPDQGGPTLSTRGGGVSIEVKAPTPTPTPKPTPTPTPKPVAAAAPPSAPAPAPAVNPGFGYGVQAHMLGNDKVKVAQAIKGMGFSWLKQQVEWRNFEPSKGNYDWGGLDEVVNVSNAHGIRVLFSVLRSPSWANVHPDGPPQNFNDLGDFLYALAARYKGRGMAYEVWNEQNLKREWMGHNLSACSYVELLKIAYRRIKEADPSAIVVAGALTPTGVNDPNIAIDDRTYLQQMYACGIKGWFDALGAHPSGFNNPPDADWRTWQDPARPSFKGHPSFFFKNTMEDYRNIMVANGDYRPIWITEFGWAVGAPLPGYEYAAQNSEEERARWFVKAYQMCKNWGFVGVVFLWNLDFRIVAPGSEMALFGIMNPGWVGTPAYAALRDMPK